MTRVDTTVGAFLASSQRTGGTASKIICTAPNVLYYFFIESSGEELFCSKSLNNGLTWRPVIAITSASQIDSFAVWFDQWTPGDAGTIIHIAYVDMTSDDVLYKQLQTSTDTLGSAISVFAGASVVDDASNVTLCKTKAGLITVVYDLDGGLEKGAAKSDALPVTTFTAIADPVEAAADYFLAAPGNYADTNDFDLIYWDRSATEITMKTYDDSGNSWSESAAIGTGMTSLAATTACPQFSIAVRASDSHLMMAAWTAADTANADLRVWDINGAASITELTNAVLNSTDDQALCGIGIDSTNDDLYVFYLGKSDGSETCYTSLNCYYKVSTDGGTTWGSETLLSTVTRALTFLHVCPNFSDAEFYAIYGGTYFATLSANVSAYYAAGGGGGLAANPLRGFV